VPNDTLLSPLKDVRAHAVIERLIESPRLPSSGSPSDHSELSSDPFDYAEYGFSIGPTKAISSICYAAACALHASLILRLR
jgi:hypothetical protein